MVPRFSHVRPTAVADAARHLTEGSARLHAGGTDLLGCLRDGVFAADTVVSLSMVPGLKGVSEQPDGGLRIGAMTPLADIAAAETIQSRYTALAEAAGAVGSPQLRHQGTVGGNLCQKPRCWYYRSELHCLRKGGEQCFAYSGDNRYHCILGGDTCYIVHPSDTAPALIALQAVARVTGADGSRSVAVESLHMPPATDPLRETVLEPDEILTELVMPAPPAGLRSSYRKVRSRGSWDFALSGVALALVLDDDTVTGARVVLSGVAPIPWRAREAETVLTGQRLDADTIRRAAEAAVAGAEPLEHNAYKVPLTIGLVTDQLEAMARG
jgi:xanthine dehydrogenase YagS FAD-binding subunit